VKSVASSKGPSVKADDEVSIKSSRGEAVGGDKSAKSVASKVSSVKSAAGSIN